MPRLPMYWFVGATVALAGCTPRSAPYVTVFESYFPAWILCVIIGIAGASMVRVLLVRWNIDEVLPWKILVYLCVAAALMFLSSLLLFSR